VAKLKVKEKVQPSQDNHETMVKKLEKRIIVTRSISQQSHKTNDHKTKDKMKLDRIKCYKCSHMGHYASMCSFKEEDNSNQSKRQRSLAQRRCFGCHEKGHKIEACTNRAKVPSGKLGGIGFAKPVASVLGSVIFLLRRRQSRVSGDFFRDSGLSKNSGEKSGVSGVH
jgi:hypothetical protein